MHKKCVQFPSDRRCYIKYVRSWCSLKWSLLRIKIKWKYVIQSSVVTCMCKVISSVFGFMMTNKLIFICKYLRLIWSLIRKLFKENNNIAPPVFKCTELVFAVDSWNFIVENETNFYLNEVWKRPNRFFDLGDVKFGESQTLTSWLSDFIVNLLSLEVLRLLDIFYKPDTETKN